MTTERDKAIVAAAIEAAAKEAERCYVKSTSLFELGTEAEKAIHSLDRDAIIASVPEKMNDRYGDGSQHAICKRCGFCSSCGDCTCAPTEGKP